MVNLSLVFCLKTIICIYNKKINKNITDNQREMLIINTFDSCISTFINGIFNITN